MKKFTTIHPNLFNNTFGDNIPEWMKDIDIKDIKEKDKLNIEFDKREAWAEGKIQRDERDYSTKVITAKLNNNEILLSKIELSKFLKSKHYDIKKSEIIGNNVYLKTTISNMPGEFVFIYNINNNKIINNQVFKYNDNEYPFNKIGFEECLADIKNNKVVTSCKVENVNAGSIISREEIFRRYNGHIREATDKINELLKDGSIIGVTSSSYGTFLDVDYLFPQQEKEKAPKQASSFEFVDNIEKTTITQHKSAYQLAMEASRQFENVYDDYDYLNYERKGNKLKITAKVLSNGLTTVNDVVFDIVNEKVMPTLLAQADTTKKIGRKQTRLNKKNIISKKYVGDLIKNNGFINSDINVYFDNFVINNILVPIDSDKYTSEYTLYDLLQMMDLQEQDKEKYNLLIDKVNNLRLERNNVQDTGVRYDEDIEFSKQGRYVVLNNYLTKIFKTFDIFSFRRIDNDTYKAIIKFSNNGVQSKLKIDIKYNGTRIDNVMAKLNNKNVPIKEAVKLFKKVPVLNEYLTNNKSNDYSNNIIITLSQLYSKLKDILSIDTINKVVNDLFENKLLQNIGGEKFISEYTFEELLYLTNPKILTNKEKNKLLQLKKYFGEGLNVYRNNVIDTGVRKEFTYSTEYRLSTLYNYLSQKFTKFSINKFSKIDKNNYQANIIFNDNGIRKKLVILIQYQGTKISRITATVNNENMSLKDAINLISKKSSLKKYLKNNEANIFTDKIVLTISQIYNKLLNFVDKNIIDDIVESWIDNNYIINIGNDTFVSEYTFEELITLSDIKILSDKEISDLVKLKTYFGEGLHISRFNLIDTGLRKYDEYCTNETLINNINKYLYTYFNDFRLNGYKINKNTVDYNITIFNDEIGLNMDIDLNVLYDKNKIKGCNCIINNEVIDIDNVQKVFIINDSLNKYLTIYNKKKFNSPIIISKYALKDKLNKISNISDDNFNNIVDLLIQNNKLNRIGIDKFVSNYTLEELINLSNIKPLSDAEFLDKIQKAQVNNISRLSKRYIQDNDTRELINEWTDKEIQLYIVDKLSSIFKCYDVLNFEINKDKYVVSIKATDLSGLNKVMLCYFNIDKGHPGDIIEIVNLDNTTEEIDKYLENYKPNIFNNKGIITKKQLTERLFNMIDVKNIDNIIDSLISNNMLDIIETDKYVTKCTLTDIISYLSKNNQTNLKTGKNNVLKRIDDSKKIDTNVRQDIEPDTRRLVKENKLSLQGVQIKNKLLTLSQEMYDNKKITLNRLNNIKTRLDKAVNEMELNDIHQELCKCL